MNAVAQTKPNIGEPMPDFTLGNITHYKNKSASLADFKGNWVFLDFWFTGCTSCINSFSKISALQEQFDGKAQFVLVGLNDLKYNKGIENLYERFQKKQNLKMASAFDSVLARKWNIISMPHIFVINPEGILYNVSDGRDFNAETIGRLINGENVKMYRKDVERTKFDPFCLSELKSKIIYQSVLTQWNGQEQEFLIAIKDRIKYLKESVPIKLSMVPLKFLYRLAYTGYSMWDSPRDSLYEYFYPDPILEVQDKSYFDFDYKYDFGKGTYNYGLIVPTSGASINHVMNIMQNDLKNSFGYDVKIETRKMSVWKLVITDKDIVDEKLKTKGGEFIFESTAPGNADGFIASNLPIETFLRNIMHYISLGLPPYFNETEIKYNIDIRFEAILTDFNSVKGQLNEFGLDLVKGTRQMKVIVIRDPVI